MSTVSLYVSTLTSCGAAGICPNRLMADGVVIPPAIVCATADVG